MAGRKRIVSYRRQRFGIRADNIPFFQRSISARYTFDGVVDAGESGIPFITVNLCSDAACSSVVDTTETDENGIYSFGNITNGG